nr:PREDICTED: PDZ and LIM domain protein 2 [Latimeria chalumnae]|eukprot:XP_005992651.1 PREDICTED: PDZ and LIM domain protein 2 [Latimeria chalumnae]
MSLMVNLIGPSPWGFRITGGRDFNKPIAVSKVNEHSKAEEADLRPGDVIKAINGLPTTDMLHVEAQNKIKSSTTKLLLTVERPEPTSLRHTNGIISTEILATRFQDALPTGKENYVEYSPSSTGSLSPRPTSPYSPQSPGYQMRSSYSTLKPFPAFSPGEAKSESPASSKSFQTQTWSPKANDDDDVSYSYRGHSLSKETGRDSRRSTSPLGNTSFYSQPPSASFSSASSPGSPKEFNTSTNMRASPNSNSMNRSSDFDPAMKRFDQESEVYKMIQENRESKRAPRQSSTFHMLQEVLEADEKEAAARFPGKFSPNAPKSVAGVQKFHTCEKCGASIVNQAVRIMENHYRHPECYTCTDCGLNLKMRGHFWVGDLMYCEKHAKERYQAPEGAKVTAVYSKS